MTTKTLLAAALLLPCAAVAAEIREYSRDAAFIEDYRRGAIAMCRKMTERVNASLPDHDLPGRPGVRCGRQFSAGGHFEQFFLWDTSFSIMWARLFPQENFPIEEALDNFYTFQEPSGYICREIFNDGRIAWKAPHPVGLNPPLLAWAELESYRAGVTSAERLRRVLPNLEKFHEFYRRHCRRADGLYFSTLLGCGMDDLPRWPVGMKEDDLSEGGLVFTRDDIGEAYAKSAWDDQTDWIYRLRKKQNWNRQAGWIDTSAQMAFDCLNLAEIAEIVGDGAKAAAYRAEHAETAEAINRLCWDEEKGFYFDCWKKGLIHRWQAGAFWTLIAKVAPPDRAKRMLAALFNEEIFWCASGIRCLGRNDPDYSPYETYWCGSVWPPVMYMTIKGLAAYGFDAEADRVARRWYDANALMWERHRDIYENLQPDEPDTLREGLMGGEWTGWSALAALALPIEMGWSSKPCFTIAGEGAAAAITVGGDDWPGVRRAANDLAHDIERVTGARPTVRERSAASGGEIIVGTIGKSRLVDTLIAAGKLDVAEVKGRWEASVIQVVDGNLVIAGADKRGTIFAVYEVSKRIGVSPWHWWADVPPKRRPVVTWDAPRLVQPSPKVKYRGVFINDEWPSFGGWTCSAFGGFNSKMYAHLFELLLRLKANYLWPAMWSAAFFEDDPENRRLADEYGIVVGTSHHEPMMRAHQEYARRRAEIGPWDYETNRARIEEFFRAGVERARPYECLVTIGMRGDGDAAMGRSDEASMSTLAKVVKAQRDIISDVYGAPDAVPQLWAVFTEVQRYYDAGFRVPEDVTLLFCDNNWGYVRRLAPPEERGRKGGFGLYYHIDMNGGPWNDRCVNTTTLPKLREQFSLAYRGGLDRVWIVNVGDLKPKEVPVDFILSYAWDPDAIGPGDERKWLERWAAEIFGPDVAADAADIIAKYSKYNLLRKPEVNAPGMFSAENYNEAARMTKMWRDVAAKAEEVKSRIPSELQDAYFELVYYPAVASACVGEIYLAATIGDEARMKELFDRDRELSAFYNEKLAGGKWKKMMSDVHIGYDSWQMPKENRLPEAVRKAGPDGRLAADSKEYSICALDFVRNIPGEGARWIALPDLGRGRGCMGGACGPEGAAYATGNRRARLEYDVETAGEGRARFAVGILPTQDVRPERGLRLGVSIDGGEVRVLDARQGMHDEFREYTPGNLARSRKLKPLPERNSLTLGGAGRPRRNEVFDNMRWLEVSFDGVTHGHHTLALVMIDPEVVVERIVVQSDDSVYSYFGPPERRRKQ